MIINNYINHKKGNVVMNYLKIYNQLIETRKTKTFIGYGERHHIIPKCMGGTNTKENIVRLKAREHFIAHLLLAKSHKTPSLIFAANMMMYCNKKKYTNRTYEWIKTEHSKLVSDLKKGKLLAPSHIKILSDNMKGEKNPNYKGVLHIGKKRSDDFRKKQSEDNSGVKNSMYGKKGKLNPFYGKKHTEEVLNFLRTSKTIYVPQLIIDEIVDMKNKNICAEIISEKFNLKLSKIYKILRENQNFTNVIGKKFICEFCNKESNKTNYLRWHGNNCKLKGGKLK